MSWIHQALPLPPFTWHMLVEMIWNTILDSLPWSLSCGRNLSSSMVQVFVMFLLFLPLQTQYVTLNKICSYMLHPFALPKIDPFLMDLSSLPNSPCTSSFVVAYDCEIIISIVHALKDLHRRPSCSNFIRDINFDTLTYNL